MTRFPRRGLRRRTAVVTAAAALLVSTSMALLTFQLTRSYLTQQRDRLAARQAYLNARLLQDLLPGTDPADIPQTMTSLTRGGGSRVLLRYDGTWLGSSVGLSEDDLPDDVVEGVARGDVVRRRVTIGDQPHVVVGVPLLDGRAGFYELLPLTELARTLRTMALALAASAAITTVAGAVFGARFSSEVLRPLGVTSAVARRIAAGDTDQRLPASNDPELAPLFDSFNQMVDALAERIERERRFAADVSHELRTPLTALVASSAVLQRQLDQLPPRAQAATEILADQLEHFRSLVLDLLEMARMEAGVDAAVPEPTDLRRFVHEVVHTRPAPHPCVRVEGIDGPVLLDRRRLERVLVNLLDNAESYGGGATDVEVSRREGFDGDRICLVVDDAGPGIAPDERAAIFERLHRGTVARANGHRGSGLGLALVVEHLRLQGGSVSVESSPHGGARFVVDLPLRAATEVPA